MQLSYIPTYGLCFRTQMGVGPLCFWRENDPQKWFGSTPATPKLKVVHHPGLTWHLQGVKVEPWCPWFMPLEISSGSPRWSNRIYSCFCPCPSRVPFPTTKTAEIQENCHCYSWIFFWYTQMCQKDRDGCWTHTSRLASLEHVMCNGLKMSKDIFKLFQVVSDCNNTKFNISYVSFFVKISSH